MSFVAKKWVKKYIQKDFDYVLQVALNDPLLRIALFLNPLLLKLHASYQIMKLREYGIQYDFPNLKKGSIFIHVYYMKINWFKIIRKDSFDPSAFINKNVLLNENVIKN